MSKIIFLPHCLRNPECKAKLTEEGYVCIDCKRCKISDFRKKAIDKGYQVYIVPGASLIKKILSNQPKPEVVIGVACDVEMKEGIEMLKKLKINAKGLKLLRDGCVNTDADFDELERML